MSSISYLKTLKLIDKTFKILKTRRKDFKTKTCYKTTMKKILKKNETIKINKKQISFNQYNLLVAKRWMVSIQTQSKWRISIRMCKIVLKINSNQTNIRIIFSLSHTTKARMVVLIKIIIINREFKRIKGLEKIIKTNKAMLATNIVPRDNWAAPFSQSLHIWWILTFSINQIKTSKTSLNNSIKEILKSSSN